MVYRLFALGMVYGALFATAGVSQAQEAEQRQPDGASFDPLGLGKMAGSAKDTRLAGEAFERFGKALEGCAATLADALARMSSEFDPFGFKTAFRTLGRQSEIIQEQQAIIQQLQVLEIERLRAENFSLRQRSHDKPHKKRKRRKPR